MKFKIVLFLTSMVLICVYARAQSDVPEFVSGAARFAIRVGDNSPKVSSDFSRTEKYHLPTDIFAWADDQSAVSVIHITPVQFTSTSLNGLPASAKATLLGMIESQVIESIKKENASVQKVPFVQSTAKGIELLVAGENRSVVRIFFINNRLYTLLARKLGVGDFEDQKKTLNTFRFLPEPEFAEAMLRDNTPAELPQDTPTGILPTDAIEQNLKGLVSEIIEEVESGTPRKRVRNLVETYSRNGFITKQIVYSGGLPDSVTTYGWVDGNRAANVAPINYRGDGWRLSGNARTIVGRGAPQGENFIGRDLAGNIVDRRYTTRYEIKYDDEWRVNERRQLTSSGDVSLVEKYTYTVTGRDVKTEDDRGGFISRKLQIVDKDGIVSEEFVLDDRGGRSKRTVFKYDFDAKGNWIVKKEFVQQVGRAGVLKHVATYYRTLKYFN